MHRRVFMKMLSFQATWWLSSWRRTRRTCCSRTARTSPCRSRRTSRWTTRRASGTASASTADWRTPPRNRHESLFVWWKRSVQMLLVCSLLLVEEVSSSYVCYFYQVRFSFNTCVCTPPTGLGNLKSSLNWSGGWFQLLASLIPRPGLTETSALQIPRETA